MSAIPWRILPSTNDYAQRCGALPYIRAGAPLREAPTPRGMGSILEPLRCSSLSQISYRSSPSVPLVEARTVMYHGAIHIEQKNIGFARSTARYEYLRGLVLCNFEHSLTHRSVITIVRDFEPERLTSS
jgi:hypothetical protein